MPRQSLIELVESIRRRSDIAYVQWRGYRRVPWTYATIAETACKFARELERRGIGKGDAVMLWGPNCAEWAVAFLGCVLRGAIVVPMDEIAASDFAQRVSQQVAVKLLVTSRAHSGATETPFLLLETLAEELHSLSGVACPPTELTPADILQIVFTSGTTAEPKGVVISHGNVLANLEPLEKEIGKYLKYEKVFHPIRFLNLLPLSHVFGQFLGSSFLNPWERWWFSWKT
jgi:long-chain acyl-CoA synthetase